MAQKRRQPKEEGLDRITLMIPAKLKARLESEVEPGVRTFSDVVRDRLRRGLDAETGEDRLSSWARVIGRHMAHLANDASGSPTADAALANMKAYAIGYLDTLLDAFREALGVEELKAAEVDTRGAEVIGQAFAQEVRRAHEPLDDGLAGWSKVARPSTGFSREQLVKDQNVLLVSPEALSKMASAAGKQHPHKGKK